MRTKFYFLLSILSIINFLGCNNIGETEYQVIVQNSTKDNDEITRATKLVKEFSDMINKPSITTKSSSKLNITLSDSKTLRFNLPNTKSENNTDSINLYTFSLETNGKTGFAIVSGDERIGEVYAYVENGSLADTTDIRGMAYMISAIPEVCERNLHKYTEDCITTKSFEDGYFDTSEFNGNLIKTEWSQHGPYNWETPSSTCSEGYYPAGCGVIAVAQIVAYYKKCDKNFDFNALTTDPTIKTSSSSYLKNEVANFVAYIGKQSHADYSCKETNTYMQSGCMAAFTQFGYKHTSSFGSLYQDEDGYERVRTCIRSGNVIIAIGQDTAGQGGHFWIVDGFIPLICKCLDSNKIHINWGWGGTANGWYTDLGPENRFTHPQGQSYNFANGLYYYYLDTK